MALEVNRTVKYKIPGVDDNMVRTGTIGEGSCFFHSVLYALSKNYRIQDIPERKAMVVDLRDKIAKNMTKQKWKELGHGTLSTLSFQSKVVTLLESFYNFIKNYRNYLHIDHEYKGLFEDILLITESIASYKIIFIDLSSGDRFEDTLISKLLPSMFEIESLSDMKQFANEKYAIALNDLPMTPQRKNFVLYQLDVLLHQIFLEVEEQGYKSFVEGLSNCNIWVDAYNLELLSNIFDRDFYFINKQTNTPYKIDCELYKHRKSVILLWVDESHFEILGKIDGNRITRDFEPDDPLIQKLYSMVCTAT